MVVNHNASALNTFNKLTANTRAVGANMEKLSSGKRINRAADDAAGLAISERMRVQVRGLNQANRNAADAVSVIQITEGALGEVQSILHRMKELATQAASETNSQSDRDNLQAEFSQLQQEMARIGEATTFNNKQLIGTGAASSLTIQIGSGTVNADSLQLTNNGAAISLGSLLHTAGGIQGGTVNTTTARLNPAFGSEIAGLNTQQLNDLNRMLGELPPPPTQAANGVSPEVETDAAANRAALAARVQNFNGHAVSLGGTAMTGPGGGVQGSTMAARNAMNAVDIALDRVSAERARLGAMQNRLEYTMNDLTNRSENIASAESRIRNVDMASEMMKFSNNQILQQVSTSMLAQANQQQQNVLALVR